MRLVALGAQHLGQALDHRGLQTFADFVDQHEFRFRHQRARHQQHFLLASGERAGALLEPRGQHREKLADALQPGIEGPFLAQTQAQIIFHAQILEQRLLLWRVGDVLARNLVRRQAGGIEPGHADTALGKRQKSHYRFQQRGLAHAVLAQQGKNLPGPDFEADIAHHQRLAVAAVHRFQFQRGGAAHMAAAHVAAVAAWPPPE